MRLHLLVSSFEMVHLVVAKGQGSSKTGKNVEVTCCPAGLSAAVECTSFPLIPPFLFFCICVHALHWWWYEVIQWFTVFFQHGYMKIRPFQPLNLQTLSSVFTNVSILSNFLSNRIAYAEVLDLCPLYILFHFRDMTIIPLQAE